MSFYVFVFSYYIINKEVNYNIGLDYKQGSKNALSLSGMMMTMTMTTTTKVLHLQVDDWTTLEKCWRYVKQISFPALLLAAVCRCND